MSIQPFRLHWLRQICYTASLILLTQPASAQNKASELARDQSVNIPPSLRKDLATLGRYADAVNQRVGKLVEGEPADKQETPATATPARSGNNLVDPFEVSPQLREGRRGLGAFTGLPNATKLDIQRHVRVKAILVTATRSAAQLDFGGRAFEVVGRGKGASAQLGGESIMVMDGELVDFGELGTYTVHINAREGVTLANPGNPQTGRITLR